ncbi:sensor histidine kinase [Dinghuibacter silviterrae]|uniref:histidine kinase n=1 Tax=Dinghuibacter silviterrae TaxID=1539049 RepID=A0A4R8DEW1_9BACT|nr:HAMP domain-containing sensor histidine kinase [Dinghuibacter silviterrae]TDW95937.1 signal transduction histidine kinase [Dinghuibacter silviterrae]
MLPLQTTYQSLHDDYLSEIKRKSDRLMNYFLVSFFIAGLLLAFFYDTWTIAIGVGGLSLLAYYSTKLLLPKSDACQYVASLVLGIFMAQYIYQMHGLFEMHFIAFIGSAILITYQNWKLQIPLAVLVIVHHATFGYLQYLGYDKIYFTQLDYMTLQTFLIHGFLATVVFFICGLWAYQLKILNERQIVQTFEMGRLQEEQLQRKALLQSNEELKKSNKELDSFVYSVSHDLRAPLTSMLGVVNLCETGTLDPFILKNVGFIKSSIKKLDGFIMDILDYSRNARLEVDRHEIHFQDLLADISNNLKFIGAEEQRKVNIRTKIKNGIPFYTDKGRLTMILNNLVSNSMRYQDPQTPDPFVEVRVHITESAAEISVLDNGIGIKEEHQEKVFNMFYRVSSKSIGSGLGLYIVKEAVDKLNGTIELKSQIGKGTEFSICLPNMTSHGL